MALERLGFEGLGHGTPLTAETGRLCKTEFARVQLTCQAAASRRCSRSRNICAERLMGRSLRTRLP